MLCPECGSETLPGASFCGQCGTTLASEDDGAANSASEDSVRHEDTVDLTPPAEVDTTPFDSPIADQRSATEETLSSDTSPAGRVPQQTAPIPGSAPVQPLPTTATPTSRRSSYRTVGILAGFLILLGILAAGTVILRPSVLDVINPPSFVVVYKFGEDLTGYDTIFRVSVRDRIVEEVFGSNNVLLTNPRLLSPNGEWLGMLLIEELGSRDDAEFVLLSLPDGAELFDEQVGGEALGIFLNSGRRNFSADGNRIAIADYSVFDRKRFYVIDAAGTELVAERDMISLGFAADGSSALVAELDDLRQFNEVLLVDIATGDLVSLIDGDDVLNRNVQYLALSNDGLNMYYVNQDGELIVHEISTGNENELYQFDERSPYFEPHLQSELILFVDEGDLYALDTKVDEIRRVDRDVVISRSRFSSSTFATAGDRIAYVTGTDPSSLIGEERQLVIATPDGNRPTEIADVRDGTFHFVMSPDGGTIAYLEVESNAEGGTLFISDTLGEANTRISRDVWSLAFSPSGRQLVYVVAENVVDNPESTILIVDVNGENQVEITPFDDGLIEIIAVLR